MYSWPSSVGGLVEVTQSSANLIGWHILSA
jgi:hypothetical protein